MAGLFRSARWERTLSRQNEHVGLTNAGPCQSKVKEEIRAGTCFISYSRTEHETNQNCLFHILRLLSRIELFLAIAVLLHLYYNIPIVRGILF